jgi:hypothetical protein
VSFAILAVAGWIGLAWRVIDLALTANGPPGAFKFDEPIQVLTNGPGLWIAGLGLAILSRSVYLMTREPAYR